MIGTPYSDPELELQLKHQKRWELKNRLEERQREYERNQMPYLGDHKRRKELDEGASADTGAERTYVWFKYFVQKWKDDPQFKTAFELQMIVHEVGINPHDQAAKELAFHELKRRYLDPREDEALKKNGDV